MAEPKTDGERIAYAEASMASGDFQKASDLVKQVIADLQDAKQTYAADIALMVKTSTMLKRLTRRVWLFLVYLSAVIVASVRLPPLGNRL